MLVQFRREELVMVFLLVLLSLLSACSSITIKPAVKDIKKVAIISLYANEEVSNTAGAGLVADWNERIRSTVAADALDRFHEEFKKIGWESVATEQISNLPAYQKAFQPEGLLGEQEQDALLARFSGYVQTKQQRYFSPVGLWPIILTQAQLEGPVTKQVDGMDQPLAAMANVAQLLDVDAVIIVELDYCYTAVSSVEQGVGHAIMTAASAIRAVDREGQVIINMPGPIKCEGKRGSSFSSALMIQGNLEFSELNNGMYRKMFSQAAEESAKISVGLIRNKII
jgi:hypothetical protein